MTIDPYKLSKELLNVLFRVNENHTLVSVPASSSVFDEPPTAFPPAAAICHAGIATLPLLWYLPMLSCLGVVVPKIGNPEVAPEVVRTSCFSSLVLAADVESFIPSISGLSLAAEPGYDLMDDACNPAPLPSLLATSNFKLRSSAPKSSSFLSSAAFHPSNAFGTRSLSPCTWFASIRDSASRLEFAALRSEITVSTSRRVASSFSVRSVSADFKYAVSAASWSIRAKAREKDSSIAALSEANCDGVGGDIKGKIYRCANN